MSAVKSHAKSIEASIVRLASERERVDAELRLLVAAKKTLESLDKITISGKKLDIAASVKLILTNKDTVTVADVVRKLKTSPAYASNILAQVGHRVSRGVYRARGSK